jgi:hypothetical protein
MTEPTPEDLEREVERLRVEREELQKHVERLEGGRRSKARGVVTIVLVVLSVLCLSAAVPGTWTRRTVLNTDRYVELTSEIAQDPAVQAYLATEITNAAFEALDVQGRLETALGEIQPQLAFLAAPITQSVRDVVQDQVEKLLASDRFATLWAEANRVAHDQILSVLQGDSESVSIVDGKVVINTLPIINEVLKGVAGLASDLVGKPVELPEITADTVPSEAITKLEAALGVDLPDDLGAIAVYDSDEIATVQQAVNGFDRGVVLLVALWLLTFIGAMAVSQRRRRTLIQLMTAFAVVIVLERRFAIASVDAIVDSLAPDAQAAGKAAAEIMVSSLLEYTKWLLAAAVATLVIALVSGPYGWAVRLRRGVVDVAELGAGLVRGTEAGPAARWLAAHRDLVMMAAAVVFVLVLLLVDVSVAWFLVLAVILGLIELAVWRTAEALSAGEGSG